MNHPLGYLLWCTTRNRISRQLARLRSPRYAIGLLLGLAYFGFIFSNGLGSGAPPSAEPDENGVPQAALQVLATISFVLVAAYWWLRHAVRGSLAFDPAEVQMLFPAPLSRRTLIAYRVARTQLVVLLNALLWTLILRRGGDADLAWPFRLLAAWAFFSVPTLHRLGIALTIVEPQSPRRRALVLAGRVAAGIAVAAIVVAAVRLWPSLAPLSMSERVRLGLTALETGAAGLVLAPFRALLAPFLADSAGAWMQGMAVLVGIIALHLIWVLGLPVPFEEAAAQASDERAARIAALRARGTAAGSRPVRVRQTGRHWLPLARTGHPATAIAWKNTLSMLRGGSLWSIAGSVAVVTVMAVIVDRIVGDAATGLGLMPIGAMLVVSITAGPRMLRHDLRQDLLHLELIKTYPVSGFSAVLAEMASPVLILTFTQLAMLLAAVVVTPPELWSVIRGSGYAGALLLAPVVLLAVNAVNLAMQNGSALLFPAWTRLGPGSAGVEAMGQGILMTLGMVVALLVALLPPAVEVILVTAVATPFLGTHAVTLAILLGALLLFAEVGWLVGRLGRLLERTEPSALI